MLYLTGNEMTNESPSIHHVPRLVAPIAGEGTIYHTYFGVKVQLFRKKSKIGIKVHDRTVFLMVSYA